MLTNLKTAFKEAAEAAKTGFNHFDSMTGKQKLLTIASFAFGVAGLATFIVPAAAAGFAVTGLALSAHGAEVQERNSVPVLAKV